MTSTILNNHTHYPQISFGKRVVKFAWVDGSETSRSFVNEVIHSNCNAMDPKLRKKIEKINGIQYYGFAKTREEAPSIPQTLNLDITCASVYTRIHRETKKRYHSLIFFENPKTKVKRDHYAEYRHEMGHLLDQIFSNKVGCGITETKSFQEVFSKDMDVEKHLKLLKKICKKSNSYDVWSLYHQYVDTTYCINPSTQIKGGELIAEITAMLNGGSCAESKSKGFDRFYREAFPNTVAYVKKLLWLLGKR